MDSSVAIFSRFRRPTQNTPLSQLCGSKRLFRNRYKVLQTLGRGGFGVTYLAKDVSLPGSPECVIKQLCPKVNNPAILQRASERFEREAKTLAQLGSHAQVPQLLDYFQEQGEFYLVQEYIRGVNLAKEVRNVGPLSELAVKRFLREILPVLDYIHRNQVIHRDIKPLNIIRCEDDGRLVLIDFGAVKEQIVEVDDMTQRGQSTQFVGTVGFAPPEQISLRPVFASDIYAIGMTCLYLLTGRPPMEFDCDPLTGEIMWESMLHLSDHFGKVLSKMLKCSVVDRYQSAEQVLRALELEPYLDKLADCMNTKTRSHESEAEAVEAPRYLSPIARRAQEIRDWRSRLLAKQRTRKNLVSPV
ncbi:serine/threonine protein kinase [Oscillatoria sp. FACHB-1407]|uniref:serine/threonine-protein kinase n=1 Tax=Oscillatoria sp. FACHB-1407 TaxID=2692847 RepID=UPI0016841DE4|nr:serine/threonine-protein kinase [Oscillatoria sp. FACHB-1407]MBD2464787.1 serine/threonine protein kinase [Oscillatoria sp. FACHB-1407]